MEEYFVGETCNPEGLYDKKGNYSVKSRYQIAQKIKFQEPPNCSVNKPGIWKIIWASTLPEKKLKYLCGELSKTPSTKNLWRRKVILEPICQLCKKNTESISHASVDCKSARKIWRMVHFVDNVYSLAE